MQSPILGLPPINLTSLSHIWRTLTETKWLVTFIFILFISKYVSSHNHLCAVDWKSNGHLPIFGRVGKEKEKFCVMLFVRWPVKNFLGHPGNIANQFVQKKSVSLLGGGPTWCLHRQRHLASGGLWLEEEQEDPIRVEGCGGFMGGIGCGGGGGLKEKGAWVSRNIWAGDWKISFVKGCHARRLSLLLPPIPLYHGITISLKD